MISIRKPSPEMLRALLHSQKDLGFTYQEVGLTETEQRPAGFVVDHTRGKLGEGI